MEPSRPCGSPTATRRRREIAEAARCELTEKGVEGLRMRAVAERAGINIATLDYHVGGKDGLIEVIAESIVEDFKAQHLLGCRPGASGLERLVQELRDHRDMRTQRPDVFTVLASLTRRAPSDPGIARHVVPLQQKWRGMIQAIFEDGVRDGSLRPDIDPPAATRLFIWSLNAMGEPEHLETTFPQFAAELLRAFAADRNQPFQGYFQ